MAKVEHTSDACVLVGIDISKHWHEVLIAVPGKTRRLFPFHLLKHGLRVPTGKSIKLVQIGECGLIHGD